MGELIMVIAIMLLGFAAIVLSAGCVGLRARLDDANEGITALRKTVQLLREKNYESEIRYLKLSDKNDRLQAILESYDIQLSDTI